MITEESNTVNDSESTHSTTTNDSDTARCISCGEVRFERYKVTLRQPLRGGGYGRIIETGSVCEQCATELRSNARTEGER